MKYIDGLNVSDVADLLLSGGKAFQGRTEITLSSLSSGLSDWLASFHVSFDNTKCRGDTILRNFILSDGHIFGLDFEEAHEGDPILDLGELCANILGMRPVFSKLNFEFASMIVSSYWDAIGEARSADIGGAIAAGLEHYARFRQDGGLLEEWARKFRAEGAALLEQAGR
jgi:aminoglycoside phosphotransferase (APT) family kinase protein